MTGIREASVTKRGYASSQKPSTTSSEPSIAPVRVVDPMDDEIDIITVSPASVKEAEPIEEDEEEKDEGEGEGEDEAFPETSRTQPETEVIPETQSETQRETEVIQEQPTTAPGQRQRKKRQSPVFVPLTLSTRTRAAAKSGE